LKKAIVMRAWFRPVPRIAGVIAVIALSLTACGRATTQTPGGRTAPAPSRPAQAGTPATVPGSTHTTAPAAASAATQLAAFFAAAARADGQVRHAAVLINSDIGARSIRFTPATIAAVRAIELAPVASTLPAGLPAEMLRQVLVVYGDLASRRGALGGVGIYGSPGRELPIGGTEARSLLRGLRNGAPAAARFSGDFAAARAFAQRSPQVTVAAPDSRAALELALRLQSIGLRNSCSMMFGGYAPTSLAPIVWQPGTGQHSHHYEGLAGGVRFAADYTSQGGWKIIIYAC
jgi:hypothetical protein